MTQYTVCPKPESQPKPDMCASITATDLAEAIDTGDLFLQYQPKLSVNKKGVWSISGSEALVRWRHPRFGVLMPGRFISVAEEADLIGMLTDSVLREALQQRGRWFENGLDMKMAVNVSSKTLTDIQFPDRLSALLRQYGVDGPQLTLEVTETAVASNIDAMSATLARLRRQGIQLAIDKFGSDYSSLMQLGCMPFTELKIDHSLILDIATSGDARNMVTAIINLANDLNMTACADGVESQNVLDFLELAGCHSIQGFFICEPVSAKDFLKFVDAWRKDGGQRLIAIGRT